MAVVFDVFAHEGGVRQRIADGAGGRAGVGAVGKAAAQGEGLDLGEGGAWWCAIPRLSSFRMSPVNMTVSPAWALSKLDLPTPEKPSSASVVPGVK